VAQVLRQRIRFPSKPTSGRTLDEALAARFPSLLRRLSARVQRRPVESALRRRLLARWVRQGFQAVNRRDLDLVTPMYDPEVEFEFPLEGRLHHLPDMPSTLRGPGGLRELWRNWLQAVPDLTVTPEEILMTDDRILICEHGAGHGGSSGVPIDTALFELLHLREGRIVKHQIFDDREAAVRALRAPGPDEPGR